MSFISAYKNFLKLEFHDYKNFNYKSWQEFFLCIISTSMETKDHW